MYKDQEATEEKNQNFTKCLNKGDGIKKWAKSEKPSL